MKQILLCFIAIMPLSCAPVAYYQVYRANAEGGQLTNDRIVFHEKNCKIYYNLWDEGGNIGFYILNNTESDMILDLTKSFFVLNDVSYEYFQKRTFGRTFGSGSSVSTNVYDYLYVKPAVVSGVVASSSSTSYEEKPNITIPSKTMVKVYEFRISPSRYIDCDLPKYPPNKNQKTLKFDRSNSPFVFYNIITYVTPTGTTRMENRFFVSELTNIPEGSMFATADTTACGTTLTTPVRVFKAASPDKFYVKYLREN